MEKKRWDDIWKFQVFHLAHLLDEQNNVIGITTDIEQTLKAAFEKLKNKEEHRKEFNKEFKFFCDYFSRFVIRNDFEKPIVGYKRC